MMEVGATLNASISAAGAFGAAFIAMVTLIGLPPLRRLPPGMRGHALGAQAWHDEGRFAHRIPVNQAGQI
jgi:hypothetical protein